MTYFTIQTGRTPPSAPLSEDSKRPQAEDLPPEEMSNEIARHSPEGRPGDPTAGGRTIALLIMGLALGLIAGAVFVGLTVRWEAGVAVGALAILLLFLNPAVWGSILRAKERERAARNVAHDVKGV